MDNQIPVDIWERKKKMPMEDIIRFQVLIHCHLNRIRISPEELNCLTLIGLWGSTDLNQLCAKMEQLQVYKSSPSARNALDRMKEKGLINKVGKTRKKVSLSDSMNIKNKGNILVDIKLGCYEAVKS